MAYADLFEEAAAHVRGRRVQVTFTRGRPVTAAIVARAFRPTGLVPPADLVDLYSDVGDGLTFAWSAPGDRAPGAEVQVPAVALLVADWMNRRNRRLSEWNDSTDFPHSADPAWARETARRMRRWVTIDEHGNGSRFCLDTAVGPAPVVFAAVAWMGGAPYPGHGLRLAPTLRHFLADWSQVCFQGPRSAWWPSVFHLTAGGVDWNGQEFDNPFRLDG